MSDPVEQPPSFPPRATPALRARRCSRHLTREAVARCPVCGGFFCRECVVEHDGQLICASCLARQIASASPSSNRRQKLMGRLREGATLSFALLLLWWLFYGFGSMLLRIPPEVHDGTIWKPQHTDSDESSD